MKTEIKLTREQRIALIEMDNAAYALRLAMANLNNCWDTLEQTNSPIGFMDTQYPFADRFNNVAQDVQYWTDHIGNKIQQIINS